MKMPFTVIAESRNEDHLLLHPTHAENIGIYQSNKTVLRFGIQSKEVHVIISEKLKPSEIGMSQNLLEQLDLPRSPLYDIQWKAPDLWIGPYMGLLVTHNHDMLRKRLDSLTSFVRDYRMIGGAILVFSLEGVKIKKRKIHGFLYNPHNEQWDEGMYPYPTAMFSIIEASMTNDWSQFTRIMKHFHDVLGDRIFNYPVFDKWEMHQWLSKYPLLERHLPKTILYHEPSEIYEMVRAFRQAYIKPILGRLGIGVMKVQMHPSGILLKYRVDRKNREILFENPRDFQSFFLRHLTPGNYIIQQALDLISMDGRIVDFRLILVKNQKGNWTNIGLFGRHGAKNSIVSNISAGGYPEEGKDTLRNILRLSAEEVDFWDRAISYLAVKSASAMEEYGVHCGNLGLDLALDTRGRLWILEINNQNPDPYIALRAGKEETFLNARRLNMLYCRRLAGFPGD